MTTVHPPAIWRIRIAREISSAFPPKAMTVAVSAERQSRAIQEASPVPVNWFATLP